MLCFQLSRLLTCRLALICVSSSFFLRHCVPKNAKLHNCSGTFCDGTHQYPCYQASATKRKTQMKQKDAKHQRPGSNAACGFVIRRLTPNIFKLQTIQVADRPAEALYHHMLREVVFLGRPVNVKHVKLINCA